ncbi:MAG: ABC transporter ATP-binding protein [Acidimicrobiaceae bacterium]|nr:ABC transporter ATP-binding protein [Acidimicrobiaceae bacterium]
MLQIEDLTVSYGAVKALKSVSFEANEAKITAVLGANGAGKTTLLRALSGLVHATTGSAKYHGTELIGKKPEDIVYLGVAQVPEGRGVIGELTIEENLRLGGLFRRDASGTKSDINEVYEFFPPLAQRRSKPTFTLSGGERQMLAIGRAIVARPTLLLLDEPSLGLAPLITASIMSFIKGLCHQKGLTVLLVEQNARSALSIADFAVVLSVGEVVIAKDAAQVASDSDLRHHYLGF